jgi:hypothetical protein
MTRVVLDKNGRRLINGDTVDLHQTVNGCNIFLVLDVETLDVRYAYDTTRKYEYDAEDLFRPCKYSGEVDFEIVRK